MTVLELIVVLLGENSKNDFFKIPPKRQHHLFWWILSSKVVWAGSSFLLHEFLRLTLLYTTHSSPEWWCALKTDNFRHVWEANHRRQCGDTDFSVWEHGEPIHRASRIIPGDHKLLNLINPISCVIFACSHQLITSLSASTCLSERGASSKLKLPDRNLANLFWHWRTVNTHSHTHR